MVGKLRTAFDREMAFARSAELSGDWPLAISHLERAHILGQRSFPLHMISHFHMLRLALAKADAKEARGQIVRLIGAVPAHIIGWVPIGNTGGANVSAVRPMPLPPEFATYFKGRSLRRGMALRAFVVATAVAAYLALRN